MKFRHIMAFARIVMLLVLYICTLQPGPSSVKVRNAAQAVSTAFDYLRKKKAQDISDSDIKWQEQILYAPGPQDLAITSKLYKSDSWAIEVSQGVTPLSRTVYQITVFNSELHRYWQGNVRADGSITEVSAYRLLSEEESREIEEEFYRKSQVPAPKPGGYGH